MKYSLRRGVVLENLYGKYLLIADENARKYCSFLTELDPTAALILEKVTDGISTKDMARYFAQNYHDEEHVIQKEIENFLQQMQENHFLVVISDKT